MKTREGSTLFIAFAAVAMTRIAALSRSMWDWDEALFCLGVRDYDVPAYRPHPPGFPLFVGAAKLLRPIAGSDFHGSWIGGALLLGIAIGVRPQTLLLGCAPFLAFAWSQRKRWNRIAAAIGIVAAVAGASYLGAALASSSVKAYRASVAQQGRYIWRVDSVANPARQPLASAANEFLLRPMAGGRLSIVVCLLAGAGAVSARRAARVALACATFLPFAVFALFMLDAGSAHRFATAYLFLYALLAAEGARVLIPVARGAGGTLLIVAVIGRYAWWTAPALAQVRGNDSPPVAAMQSLHAADVDFSLEPFADYFLRDRASTPHMTEGLTPAASARLFARPRGRVWEIARHRFFEVSILPRVDLWGFGNGWYDQEDDGRHAWRWMGGRSVTTLPALSGRGRLSLTLESIAPQAIVEVRAGGVLIDRFTCTAQGVTKEWEIAASHPVIMDLSTTATARVERDPRLLGLRLTRYDWSAH